MSMTKKEKEIDRREGDKELRETGEMKEGLNGSGHCLQMCQN